MEKDSRRILGRIPPEVAKSECQSAGTSTFGLALSLLYAGGQLFRPRYYSFFLVKNENVEDSDVKCVDPLARAMAAFTPAGMRSTGRDNEGVKVQIMAEK